jgi:hypothetical protein
MEGLTVKKLVLQSHNNKVSRVFHWDGQLANVICREDNRRVELHSDLKKLDDNKVFYKKLALVDPQVIKNGPIAIDKDNVLALVDRVENVVHAPQTEKDNNKLIYIIALVVFLLNGVFMGVLKLNPPSGALEEELKQQVVQIVKKIPPKEVQKQQVVKKDQATVQTDTKKKFNGIKRLGALAVLGSLNKSSQKGGLNLNAVNTTAGPGLGGTEGSGGVQTSIYGKGLVAAPLGAGANMAGGGGYGTKGKGGGQAGYGKLSMVGSAGNMPIPLGKEALIDGGLDLEMVSEVIRRNMGQIRFCYEQGLQLDPALAGRVGVKFVIGANGQVKLADVENTTLNSKQIEDCILLRLRSWKFPLPDGGVDVKVSYPFSFKRTGNG